MSSLSDAELVEECATLMAQKNGDPVGPVAETLRRLPRAHVEIMLERLRGGG